jgi:hypothetical protein
MLHHWYQRAGSHTEVMAPFSWTMTTHVAQIDSSHQICCRIRVKRPIFVRVPIESRRSIAALRSGMLHHWYQRSGSHTEVLYLCACPGACLFNLVEGAGCPKVGMLYHWYQRERHTEVLPGKSRGQYLCACPLNLVEGRLPYKLL